MTEIARWAAAQYIILNAKQRANFAEIAELQAAGVSQSRIDALYPFSTAEYADGILAALRDHEKRSEIEASMNRVNVPFSLSIHLPEAFHEELYAYLSQAPFTNPDGSTSPSLRMGRYSEELAQFTESNEELVGIAETMLQLPHFLHLLRQHPFEGYRWGSDEQGWWQEKFFNAKPYIEAYLAAL